MILFVCGLLTAFSTLITLQLLCEEIVDHLDYQAHLGHGQCQHQLLLRPTALPPYQPGRNCFQPEMNCFQYKLFTLSNKQHTIKTYKFNTDGWTEKKLYVLFSTLKTVDRLNYAAITCQTSDVRNTTTRSSAVAERPCNALCH